MSIETKTIRIGDIELVALKSDAEHMNGKTVQIVEDDDSGEPTDDSGSSRDVFDLTG